MKNSSQNHGSIVRSALDLKSWMQKTPSVEEGRPAACPSCNAPSRPVGGRIQLHGHGVRTRQVRGPGDPADGGEQAWGTTVEARRYRCVCCEAVVLVVPREVLPRRHYSAAAIGLALALWGLVQATASAIRQRLSPGQALGFDATGWVTLRRWARAVREGKLFSSMPAADPSATLRQVARAAATGLAASADPTTRHLPIEQRAFLGAAHAA